MIVKGIKKSICLFSVFCVMVTNFNVNFSASAQVSSEIQTGTRNLSVAQEVYSTPMSTPDTPITVAQAVYPTAAASTTPVPVFTPTKEPLTVTNSVYPTSTITPTPTITPTSITTPTAPITPIPTKNEADDYGNDISDAFTIPADISISGRLDSSDPADVFCFSTDIDVDTVVTIKYSDCISASLLELSGNEVAADERHGSGALTLGVHALKKMNYYIKVKSPHQEPVDYTVSVAGPVVDDFGDTQESSKEIKLNSFIEGKIESYPDRDYFCFTPSVDGIYYIEKFSSYDSNDIVVGGALKFYDENGQILQSTLYRSFYSYKLEKGKTYYISVSNDDYVNKTFYYSFVLRGPVLDDHGNTKETATQIQVESLVEGYLELNDVDYFSFKTAAEGLYSIGNYQIDNYVLNSTQAIDRITLYDEEGNQLGRYNYSMAYYLEKDQTYYISVTHDSLWPYAFGYYILIKGPCEDDYGNKKESATEIYLDNKVEGFTNYNNDVDCFSLRAPVNGIYYIDSSTLGWDNIRVYNEESGELPMSNNGSNNYYSLENDTIYYINISRPYASSNKYSFTIKLSSSDDYGDTMKTAEEIQLGSRIKGFADILYDSDYFCFKPSESGTYYIENFYAQSSGYGSNYIFMNNVLGVVGANGGTVYPKFDNNGNKRAYINMLKDETYYMYIKNPNCDRPFTYWFQLEGPIIDDYGDSIESGKEIQLGKEVKGSINNVRDYDYFVLEPSTTGIYYLDKFTITYTYNDFPNPNIEIVDSNGTYVDMDYGDHRSNKAYFSLTKGNKYYIYVNSGSEFSMFNYVFTINGPIIDDVENTPSLSKTLEIGKVADGKIDYYTDQDFFSFTTAEKGFYSLSLNCMDSIDIILYDERYRPVSISSYSTDNVEQCFRLESNKSYYIRISAYNYDTSDMNYSICVNGPIIDDYGNSINDSSLVKMGDTKAKIDYLGDIDMFMFIPSSTGTYHFNINTDTISAIKFYDINGFDIRNTIVDANTASCNLSAYDTCFIAVNNDKTLSVGNYTLTISKALVQDTFKITGYVKPDFSDKSSNPIKAGFKVSLAGTQITTATDENGYFEITNIPKSDKGYDVLIAKDGYLKRQIKNVIVSGNISLSQSEAPIEMWAGDLDESHDGVINIKDVIMIAKAFNSCKGDSLYLESMDLDNNSVINILDMIIVAKHFNQTTEGYPQVSVE